MSTVMAPGLPLSLTVSNEANASRGFAYWKAARRTRRYHRRQRERKERWRNTQRGPSAPSAVPGDGYSGECTYIPFGSPFLNGPKRKAPHLDPYLPGFKNWDPLRLSENPTSDALSLEWLSYAEILHGRWAMLGTVGCLTPEFINRLGWFPDKITGLTWFAAGGMKFPDQGSLGAIPFQDLTQVTYWVDPATLCFSMLVLMGLAETRRMQDFKNPGSMGEQDFLGLETALGGSGDPKYPGGQLFNLFNLGADSPQQMDQLKTKEVTHGRLAMVAMLGLFVQASVTHVGPVQNLVDVLGPGTTFTFADYLMQNPTLMEYFASFTALSALAIWLWYQDNYPSELSAERSAVVEELTIDVTITADGEADDNNGSVGIVMEGGGVSSAVDGDE